MRGLVLAIAFADSVLLLLFNGLETLVNRKDLGRGRRYGFVWRGIPEVEVDAGNDMCWGLVAEYDGFSCSGDVSFPLDPTLLYRHRHHSCMAMKTPFSGTTASLSTSETVEIGV